MPPIRYFRFVYLLIAALALGVADAVAQTAEGLSPLQVAQIETVSSSAISPDGRHVAFTRVVPGDPFQENVAGTPHLYVLDTQTGAVTGLHTVSSAADVAFRPVHGTITFLASIDDREPRALYEVPVTGGSPMRLVAHERAILGYEWNPDGNRVAFQSFERVDAPVTPLPYRPTFYEENLAQRMAYIHDVRSNSAARPVDYVGSYHTLAWSPSGEWLAVAVAPTPMVDDMFMFQEVKVVDPRTGVVVAEIDNAGKIDQIIWSPDERHLALRAGDHMNDTIAGRIMIVSTDGGTPRNILPNFEAKFEQIAWTGADTIHFIASESTEKVFGTIAPDGSGLTRIVGVDALNLISFERAGDGSVAFVANTPQHPTEVYLLRTGADQPIRMTDSNPWLSGVPMGEQRVVNYTARDGMFDIDGLLILPVGYDEGTALPVITVVHGGPEAHYSNGWLTAYQLPGQMAAGRGYAVFYPNYRGSTGRGLAFTMSSQADAAGKEFDDIVDGVDYLIAEGIVDAGRVGVTGGSYGGYATAWMSTYYSERFAAGVMNVGISNNISKWGTSDIPHELHLVHSREWIWENNWQKYLERSPIYHVDNAQTPLLIMHGADDTRVHPGQSLELYRHIVVRKPEVPVRLILYPGEGHGNIRSASRYDFTLRMMGWFDSYLMGDGSMPSLDLPAVEAMPVGGG